LAYRKMQRRESGVRKRLKTEFPHTQTPLSSVTTKQFFGLDIIEFAVELAKVTLMIGHKLAIDELPIIREAALPLDNLDDNFKAVDALIDEVGNQRTWPPADVIIGNPPFLGAKKLKPDRGADYVNK